jgi:hypothetical protein
MRRVRRRLFQSRLPEELFRERVRPFHRLVRYEYMRLNPTVGSPGGFVEEVIGTRS